MRCRGAGGGGLSQLTEPSVGVDCAGQSVVEWRTSSGPGRQHPPGVREDEAIHDTCGYRSIRDLSFDVVWWFLLLLRLPFFYFLCSTRAVRHRVCCVVCY